MKTVKISLDSIDKVKTFVNEINRFDADFDLVAGRYVIDAKSIMGIFSLDIPDLSILIFTTPIIWMRSWPPYSRISLKRINRKED